jgi:hypothetical protein
MRITILIISVLLIFSGCGLLKKSTESSEKEFISRIHTQVLDSVPVYLPGGFQIIEIPIDCPDQDLLIDSTDQGAVNIEIRDKKMKARISTPSDTVYRYIPRVKDENIKIKEVEKKVPVRYTSKFARFSIWWFFITAILIIAFIYFKYLRKWL